MNGLSCTTGPDPEGSVNTLSLRPVLPPGVVAPHVFILRRSMVWMTPPSIGAGPTLDPAGNKSRDIHRDSLSPTREESIRIRLDVGFRFHCALRIGDDAGDAGWVTFIAAHNS